MDRIHRSSQISRLTHEEHGSQGLSGRLDEPIMGWLSIYVTFLGEPVSDLAIWFWDGQAKPIRSRVLKMPKHRYHAPDDPDKNPAGWTRSDGSFHLLYQVPVGTYVCKIQGQPPTDITTVEDAEKPFVLV